MKRVFIAFLEYIRVSCLLESTTEGRGSGCQLMACNRSVKGPVCGLRNEEGGVRLRLFENECKLQEYECIVGNTEAYSLVNMDYCGGAFDITEIDSENSESASDAAALPAAFNPCDTLHCSQKNTEHICAVRKDGDGYRIRLFLTQCDMLKHNCAHSPAFNETDPFICQDLDVDPTSAGDINENLVLEEPAKPKLEHVIVIDARSIDYRRNLNESVEDFFAATHTRPLPLDQLPPETRRNMVLKTASPVVIFKPWVRVPKNKSDDYWHRPTLSSCYHKCPVACVHATTNVDEVKEVCQDHGVANPGVCLLLQDTGMSKCPDTYTPVCGVPGMVAREPSLIFQNHCFMDKAQCKMFWEDKSPTAESSNYVEGSFIFCLGDELTSLYRFLPLIKSLQRMGRLKQRGKFRYKLRNLRFVNNLVVRNPKIMG